jgi:citrate synthase
VSVAESASSWISTAAACQKLGIRPQTLYAYVSRGLISPHREGRRSYFSIAELEQLETRARRSLRRGRVEVSIDSLVTLLDPDGRLFYRGEDVTVLATTWSFERTAEWLWTGVSAEEPRQWPVANEIKVVGNSLTDRLRNTVAILGSTAPNVDTLPASALTIGRKLLPQLVASLPAVGTVKSEARAPLAAQLWPRLSSLPLTKARFAALNCALIVFADHELVPSTIGARLAASTGAAPLDSVLVGLAMHAGVSRHGFRASIEEAIRSGSEPLGAYDHVAYRVRDPRADVLVPLIQAASSKRGWRLVDSALTDDRPPTADLAIAALSVAGDMVPTASEVIYTVARVAGLLAHIGEEYDHPSMFRPRVGYRGPAPDGFEFEQEYPDFLEIDSGQTAEIRRRPRTAR